MDHPSAPDREMEELCAGLQMSGDEWGILQEVLQSDVSRQISAYKMDPSFNFAMQHNE